MSQWFEVTDDEIDVDHDDKEVSFFVCSSDFGNVYLSLSFEQVKDIYEKTVAKQSQ